jgi:hypothetical protein
MRHAFDCVFCASVRTPICPDCCPRNGPLAITSDAGNTEIVVYVALEGDGRAELVAYHLFREGEPRAGAAAIVA